MRKNTKKNRPAAKKTRTVKKGRPVRTMAAPVKMKLKKGDTVVVVSGKDKGKQGVILTVMPASNRIVVDGVAMVKRHVKKASRGQHGGIVEHPASIHASNVMFLDGSEKKGTRIGRRMEGEKKVRFAKKTKAVIK